MFMLSRFVNNRLAIFVFFLASILCGCGGGGDGGNTVSTTVSVGDIQSGTASLATTDPSAAFTELPAGVAAVTVNSPPVVNFVLKDTASRFVTGLQAADLRFAIAKLVPGTPGVFGVAGTGESDQWVSYIYQTKSGTAITDGVQATYENGGDGTLVYNEQGYYTYTFAIDIKEATRPDDTEVIWDPTATHRLAIQLDIRDSEGNRILYNPHFDFTFSNGASVAITDPSKTHRVADESSCNECHNKLTAHGGRVEVEYCVMCHNSGSIDVEFGSDIDFKVMIHKIHKGKALDLVPGYKIGGFGGVVHDWSEVGYPQDLRNCAKCHDGDNPLTPQGDNWNTKPTQQACGACHESVDFNNHQGFDFIAHDDSINNSACKGCHGGAATNSSVINAHWNQFEEHSKNYQFNIGNLSYDPVSRQATVTYSITNPNDGTAYDLTEGLTTCIADILSETVQPSDCLDLEGASFSRFTLYIGALTLAGASSNIDEYTDHSSSTYAWLGTDNGDGTYTTTLTVPASAVGAARLLSNGQAQERRVIDFLDYRLAIEAGTEINAGSATANGVDWDWANQVRVPVANVHRDFSVDGSVLNARRTVVSDAKCNACHGLLGTATSSNEVENAFHRGERSSVVTCPVCHTPNRASSTGMSDEIVDGVTIEPVLPGTTTRMNQSYEFKTMIHGIHGGERRTTAYPDETEDLSGKTHYPGILGDCTACHVDDTYATGRGKLGAAVTREGDIAQRRVFSPNAAACMGCHDTAAARNHMNLIGGASVGEFTQAQWLNGAAFERCAECHGLSGAADIKSVHNIK